MVQCNSNIILNENILKARIINNYARKAKKPFFVCNELNIAGNKKIVDIVFCKSNKSCAFEIKAINDDTRRLSSQLETYCNIFDFVYVAVTNNHISKLKEIPDNVGIVTFSCNGKVIISRHAKQNTSLNINEIISSIPIYFIRKNSQHTKYTRASNSISMQEAHQLFTNYLREKSRWSDKELSSILHYEDIIKDTQYMQLNY